MLFRSVSLAFLAIDVADGVDPAAAEAAAMEELTRFADEGPSSVEMESALAQSERSWLSALASQEDRADLISQHALLYDDAGFVNTFLDRLALVDADRVRLAADRWLRPTSRAVVSFIRSTSEEAA